MSRPIQSPTDRQDVFRAIANPMRRRIIARLAKGPTPASALNDADGPTSAALTQHLNVLAETGLVSARRTGRTVVYSLNKARLRTAERWLARQLKAD